MVRKWIAVVLKLFGFIFYVIQRTLGLVSVACRFQAVRYSSHWVHDGGIWPCLYADFPRAFLINGYHSRGIKTKVEYSHKAPAIIGIITSLISIVFCSITLSIQDPIVIPRYAFARHVNGNISHLLRVPASVIMHSPAI